MRPGRYEIMWGVYLCVDHIDPCKSTSRMRYLNVCRMVRGVEGNIQVQMFFSVVQGIGDKLRLRAPIRLPWLMAMPGDVAFCEKMGIGEQFLCFT